MISVQFDYKQLEDYAQQMGARIDQIPYALSLAMNRSADVTRNLLIKSTWPTHVQARNSSFIAASLTTRDARASKSSLAVEIYDRLDRGNLQMQAKGGVRTPRGGSNLAIPSSNIHRTARGVPKTLKPANLRNSFKKNNMLFQRDSRGRARLVYTLKHTTPIPKRVPFYEDFANSMRRELTRTIPLAVAKAMATARKV
jgi:hypothetical protein